jgi:hypothetical protein
MATNSTGPIIVRELPPVPSSVKADIEMWRFLDAMRNRVGGASGNIIYDNAIAAQSMASSEPQLAAQIANLEDKLTGLVSSIIEQIQQNLVDSSGLFDVPQQFPPIDMEPPDFNVGGIIQQAKDAAPVQSVFGRSGAVTAAEADYNLTQLGDVIITAPASGQGLTYNGATWLNTAITASAFSGILPVTNGGTNLGTLTANNLIVGAGTSSVTFIAPGSSGNVLTSNGTVWQSAAPAAAASHPQGDRIVAAAGQTVFNFAITVTANSGANYYTMVTKNGLVLSEGGGNDYTVTGASQITLVVAAALNDIVTVRTWT